MKYPAKVYSIMIMGVPKFYVGLSSNPKRRFEQHQYLLSVGKHPVEDMQADYDASDSKDMNYIILDEVASASERYKEHEWQIKLRTYEREYGYNYKDPTARAQIENSERRKQYIAFQKERIRRVIYAGRKPPIPLSEKKRREHEEFLKATAHLSDEEFLALYLPPL